MREHRRPAPSCDRPLPRAGMRPRLHPRPRALRATPSTDTEGEQRGARRAGRVETGWRMASRISCPSVELHWSASRTLLAVEAQHATLGFAVCPDPLGVPSAAASPRCPSLPAPDTPQVEALPAGAAPPLEAEAPAQTPAATAAEAASELAGQGLAGTAFALGATATPTAAADVTGCPKLFGPAARAA
jgi:hypothetical protein